MSKSKSWNLRQQKAGQIPKKSTSSLIKFKLKKKRKRKKIKRIENFKGKSDE